MRSRDLRTLKRVLLAPFADAALRVTGSGLPAPVRLAAVRLVALPHLGAVDRPYERAVPQGRFAGSTTDLLQAFVYVFGVWEPVLTEFMRRRLGPGDTVVDVGANSGWYTTIAAERVGEKGRVFAVEASPVLAELLRAQIVRNGFTNVRVVEAAASDRAGVLRVDPGPAQHTGLTRVSSEGSGSQVAADTLAALVGADELASARLVKIDVEGGEYAVVRGLAGSLPQMGPNAEIVVEVGPERARDRSEVAALFATFADAEFHPYRLPNDYRVRSYVTQQIPTELARLDPSSLVEEVDVVFSRFDGDALPMDPNG